jgi:hypothetical protein
MKTDSQYIISIFTTHQMLILLGGILTDPPER